MKVTIQATVYEGQYEYPSLGEARASVEANDEALAFVPWPMVCTGLVEKAIADAILALVEKEKEAEE